MNAIRNAPKHVSLVSARSQRGAVLYIALIMLVLLAMIGIVGMQVTGMQERMAANYLASNVSFQNVEAEVRETECAIEEAANRVASPVCTAVVVSNQRCDDGFDPAAWGESQSFAAVPSVNIRQIDECIEGEASRARGGPVSEEPFPVYQITGYAADSLTNPSSSSVIDTVFKL